MMARKRFGYNGTNNKFGAQKVLYKGMAFDGRYELNRYIKLCNYQKKGAIHGLRRQVGFKLIKKVVKLVPVQLKTKIRYDERVVEQEARYHCDFLYEEDGKYIIEEVKSEMTEKLPDYILRRKLMVNKVYDHNARPNRKEWVFREVVYDKKGNVTITDK